MKHFIASSDHDYLRRRIWPRVPRSWKKTRIVDIYCGVGSLSLGIWEACRRNSNRIECAAAVDIDPEVLRVYNRNFPGTTSIVADVRAFVDRKLGSKPSVRERRLMKHFRHIDFLLSGSPCQGFSPLNNHTRGKDKRNNLYLTGARMVELVQPTNFIFENVPNIVNSMENVVQLSESHLKEAGYEVEAAIVDLSSLGVPQTRKRHVLVGSKSHEVSVRNTLDEYRTRKVRSVRWAIEDLEKPWGNGLFDTPSRQTKANLDRIDYLHRTNSYDLPDSRRPKCHRKSHSYKSMYSRLRYDKPAQTITSGFGSPGQGRFVHPIQARTLTPHEAARLQFFPDFFDFSIVRRRTSLASMIGNAATMKLSYAFASTLLS